MSADTQLAEIVHGREPSPTDRERLLRAVLDGWPHAVLVADARSLRVLELNARMRRLVEGGRGQASLASDASVAELLEHCCESAGDRQSLHELAHGGRVRCRIQARSERVLDVSRHAMSIAELGLEAVLLVFEDATERLALDDQRRILERRMRELERFEGLGALAAGIAHEFNNLLTGILGSAELVLGSLGAEERARRPLERIVEAGLRAARLCEEMSASAGPTVGEVRRLHLTELTQRVLRLMQPSLSTRIRVEERFERELPAVLGDETQLRRVFENVLLNACEALEPKGGVVKVSSGVAAMRAEQLDLLPFAAGLTPGEYVWFEVEDDGIGMEASVLSHMFDPFFSTKFAGRGLGLSSSAAVIRAHKGAFEVSSQPGAGARVRVLLPAAS